MPHPCCFASPTHSVYFYIDSPLLYPCCSLWMWNKFNPHHTSVKFFALNGLFERGRCLSLNFICVCMCMSLYWLYRLLEVSAHVFEWSWVVKWVDLLLSWEGMGGGAEDGRKAVGFWAWGVSCCVSVGDVGEGGRKAECEILFCEFTNDEYSIFSERIHRCQAQHHSQAMSSISYSTACQQINTTLCPYWDKCVRCRTFFTFIKYFVFKATAVVIIFLLHTFNYIFIILNPHLTY